MGWKCAGCMSLSIWVATVVDRQMTEQTLSVLHHHGTIDLSVCMLLRHVQENESRNWWMHCRRLLMFFSQKKDTVRRRRLLLFFFFFLRLTFVSDKTQSGKSVSIGKLGKMIRKRSGVDCMLWCWCRLCNCVACDTLVEVSSSHTFVITTYTCQSMFTVYAIKLRQNCCIPWLVGSLILSWPAQLKYFLPAILSRFWSSPFTQDSKKHNVDRWSQYDIKQAAEGELQVYSQHRHLSASRFIFHYNKEHSKTNMVSVWLYFYAAYRPPAGAHPGQGASIYGYCSYFPHMLPICSQVLHLCIKNGQYFPICSKFSHMFQIFPYVTPYVGIHMGSIWNDPFFFYPYVEHC